MKQKFTKLLIALLFIAGMAMAQVPQGVNFQGVARDASGLALQQGTVIGLRLSVLQGSTTGSTVYSEEHSSVTLDRGGIFNVVMGKGTALAGTFSGINWQTGSKFLKIEMRQGAGSYNILSTTEIMSVPYAQYSGNGVVNATVNAQGQLILTNAAGNTVNAGNVVGPQGPAGTPGLQGSPGINGKTILNGIIPPTLSVGTDGDFYLNTNTNTLYGPKTVGGWGNGINLIGPQGIQGQTGPQGATGPTGPQGLSGAQGLPGPTGLQGPAGLNGNTLLNGFGAPNFALGVNGDFYLDIQSKTMYGPKTSSGWGLGFSVIGPQGSQGLQGVPGLGYSNGTAVNQIMHWNGSAWVALPSPSVDGQTLTFCSGQLIWTIGGQCPGAISSLNCGNSTISGTLTSGIAAIGVNCSIPYSGGNGGQHSGQIINSTGVFGLTATLMAGSFVLGSGSLVYDISGTPNSSGTAFFNLNIGGKNCLLSLIVANNQPTYPVGTVHCNPLPTEIVEVTSSSTGKVWMDRNLGANRVAISSTDAQGYGDLYQWGRRADGHQCRNSSNTTVLSATDQPSSGSFITTALPPYDWRSPQNANLWQGVTGVNNPCPSGFRIPTETELNAERLSWGSSQNSTGAFNSPLKLPAAGFRFGSDGTLGGVGVRGLYWSSIVSLSNSRYLTFNGNSANMSTDDRVDGFSVRCIKD